MDKKEKALKKRIEKKFKELEKLYAEDNDINKIFLNFIISVNERKEMNNESDI